MQIHHVTALSLIILVLQEGRDHRCFVKIYIMEESNKTAERMVFLIKMHGLLN